MASLPRIHPCAVVDWSAVYYSQLDPAYFDDRLPPSLSEPQICTHFSSIRRCLVKALHPQPLCRIVGSANLGCCRAPFYDGHNNRCCGQSSTILMLRCNSEGDTKHKSRKFLYKYKYFRDKRYGYTIIKGGIQSFSSLGPQRRRW